MDIQDDKHIFNDINCYDQHFCQQKYNKPDCFNEYYTIKPIVDTFLDEMMTKQSIDHLLHQSNKSSTTKLKKGPTKQISYVEVVSSDDPDTIYRHSPLQKSVEFICFIGGVISLWTGFSVFSLYDYAKRLFIRNKNKVEPLKSANANNGINRKKAFISNKKNNKISQLETKLNKVIKVMKILNKKNRVIKATSDHNDLTKV